MPVNLFPDIVIFAGVKIIDLSGLIDASQIISIAHAELEFFLRMTRLFLLPQEIERQETGWVYI